MGPSPEEGRVVPVDRLLHPRLGQSQKVSSLTHFQYRVWTQCLLSADDFGVLPADGVQLQADARPLAACRLTVVREAVRRLVDVGLFREFTHQQRTYLYQPDWQDWQKVQYPRATLRPRPQWDALKRCSEKTRLLFTLHPGGSKYFGDVLKSFPSNARAHARGTANGKRLTANGTGESEGERRFRPTPAEIERGRQWRRSVGRCTHDPTCRTSEVCIGVQIRKWRADLEGR
jgi:hypothetical protein